MEKELKELLLKDLTARLLYGVKGVITYDKSNTTFTVEGIDNNVLHLSNAEECYAEEFKPYLRPMSSMTEDEAMEYANCGNIIANSPQNNYLIPNTNCVDWLNAHHFDYRGLLEKNLALEALEGMYN